MFKTGSPLLREIVEEETREAERKAAEGILLTVLTARFGPEARTLEADLKALGNNQLEKIAGLAATCPNLASFREHLPSRSRKRRT